MYLIIGLVSVIASFPTIILNGSVILAIKRKKELQRPSHIIVFSLAVTDLLVGVTVMPISATIDFFTFRQVSFEYTCMLYAVNLSLFSLLCGVTMHHLTIIAWERYVAVKKWKDYKRILTNGRLKKIAMGIWLLDIFLTVAYKTTAVVGVDRTILNPIFGGWMAFLFAFLRNALPVFRTIAAIQLTQKCAQMNSLFNPLLYCYRDQRFRNAIRELLGLKKPQTIQSAVCGVQFFRRKYSIGHGPLEHPKVGKRMRSLKRSVSVLFMESPVWLC